MIEIIGFLSNECGFLSFQICVLKYLTVWDSWWEREKEREIWRWRWRDMERDGEKERDRENRRPKVSTFLEPLVNKWPFSECRHPQVILSLEAYKSSKLFSFSIRKAKVQNVICIWPYCSSDFWVIFLVSPSFYGLCNSPSKRVRLARKKSFCFSYIVS